MDHLQFEISTARWEPIYMIHDDGTGERARWKSAENTANMHGQA